MARGNVFGIVINKEINEFTNLIQKLTEIINQKKIIEFHGNNIKFIKNLRNFQKLEDNLRTNKIYENNHKLKASVKQVINQYGSYSHALNNYKIEIEDDKFLIDNIEKFQRQFFVFGSIDDNVNLAYDTLKNNYDLFLYKERKQLEF